MRAIHSSELVKKSRTVAFHRGFGLVLGEAQIEIALAVGPGKTSRARGETLDQPGNSLEMSGLKDLD